MAELDDSDNLIGNFDAVRWAEQFVKVRHNLLTGPERSDIAESEETMHTWFAGAIMTGFDRGRREAQRDTATLDEIREALIQRDRSDSSASCEDRP